MSFSLGFNGHTDDQEAFEQLVTDAKQFAADHRDTVSLTGAWLNGTDPNGESRNADFLNILDLEAKSEESSTTPYDKEVEAQAETGAIDAPGEEAKGR